MHKRISFLYLFLVLSLCIQAQKASTRLTTMLEDMVRREEVTPDSFFTDVALLRHAIEEQQDSTGKAIYRAVLAHRLAQNAHRSQTWRRQTASHPDSIQEWSSEEYVAHAARLYSQAMQRMQELHAAKSRQWVPVVNRGRDEAVFDGDMLSVVWQALRGDVDSPTRRQYAVADYAEIISFYKERGLREAALRLTLDSLQERDVNGANLEAALESLATEYEDLPACALVYLRKAESLSSGDPELWKTRAVSLLQETLRRYPNAPCRAEIENQLASLRAPQLTWQMNNIFAPSEETFLRIRYQNMTSVTWSVYAMPGTEQKSTENEIDYIRRNGRLVETKTWTFAKHQPEVECTDSIPWRAPKAYGRYAVVVTGKPGMSVERIQPVVQRFSVTRLDFFSQNFPIQGTRLVVVDTKSGEPQSGVSVDISRMGRDRETLLYHLTTDANGRIDLQLPEAERNLTVRLSRGDDKAAVDYSFNNSHRTYNMSRDSVFNLRVFTDRSIYRPGQTIYVAALLYRQKDWDAHTVEGRSYTLTLFDANNQVVATREAKTDAFGMLQDSLQLPSSGLPGSYRIRVGSQFHWIRVEEYRRPTFRVEMDQRVRFGTLAVGDTIRIAGRAVTYSDVPISQARVTGNFRFMRSRFGWGDMGSTFGMCDTVWTDSEGRFEVAVPVKCTDQQLRYGRLLRLNVDVLSPQGETIQGETSVPLCSAPLRLMGLIPQIIDKERIKPWLLNLYDALDQPVESEIVCTLTALQGQSVEKRFRIPAGKSTVPEVLSTLPSGSYSLKAEAQVDGNKAEWEDKFTLMSMQDEHLVDSVPLYLYCPSDTFSLDRPAQVQIGTSLPEAWIHCLMVSESGVSLDTVVHVSDTAFVWTLPYRPEYKQGATLHLATYTRQSFFERHVQLRLQQPDMRLRPHWETFRNRLHPGEHEEWRLSLRCPDGTPAHANVLLSLYDASLDALSPHSLFMNVSRSYRIPSMNIQSSGKRYFNGASLPIELRWQKTRGFEPSFFNHKYFVGPALVKEIMYKTRNSAVRMATSTAQVLAVPTAEEVYDYALASAKVTVETADDVAEAADADEEPTIDPSSVRTNLGELAFFMPCLRTEANGVATIAFTLPDALTSWRLLGFAHSADLMTTGIDETIVAQKELMAELMLPRFLRNGDQAVLTASIRNIGEETQQGKATWQILDAETEKMLASGTVRFSLLVQADTTYSIPFTADSSHPLLVVRWRAESQQTADGEQRYLPVLSHMQHITETKAFSLHGPQRWQTDLGKLFAFDNDHATQRSLTVEYTARPMWLALQSLPSLMQPVHRDILSLTSTFYAGSLAAYIAHKVPTMPEALRQWTEDGSLESPLRKNQELADMLLQETPWVVEADNEKARREHLITLFDDVAQVNRRASLLAAMRTLQQSDGSFSWYPGMKGSPWLTREVAYLLTRLHVMTPDAEPDAATRGASDVLNQAIAYLQSEMSRTVKELKKSKQPAVGLNAMRYLYIVHRSGHTLAGSARDDANYLVSLLRKDATQMQGEMRALAAIVLHLSGEQRQARSLMETFHTLLRHPDGAYLAYPSGSFTSIDRKLQIHVQLMEAIALIEPEQTDLLASMQEWLLQQKRTQEWERPAETANAVYALMQGETEWQNDPSIDVISLRDGRKSVILTSPETALGYLRTRVDISRTAREITIQKTSPSTSWGAVYAQYQIPGSMAEAQQEGLNIRRDIDADALRTGSRVHVRYTITADRDYEFVRLAAPRVAAAEPASQLSGSRWQGGLGYYCAVHDASTEYFFDHMPRGTYVIEEDWLISRPGTYQLSPATLGCLYAPEFQAHTAGSFLKTK